MSIFHWLFAKSEHQRGAVPSVRPKTEGSHAHLKVQRQDHRQHIYQIVRDVMLRSEVLAASYSFKVLSLDSEGRQFLIMVDLRRPQLMQIDILDGMEKMMISSAAARYDLRVKSVYWRCNTALPPVPAAAPTVQQSPATPVQHAPTQVGKSFEPIQPDEVLAFKKALETAQPDAKANHQGQTVKSGPRYSAPSTGFADTEMLEPEEAPSPLSSTQYGDL